MGADLAGEVRGEVDCLTADQSHQDLRKRNAVFRDGQEVLVEDDEVGELAGLQRADLLFP